MPPVELDEKNGTESSPEPKLDANAESSTATDEQKPTGDDDLSIARDVVAAVTKEEKPAEGQASASSAEEGEETDGKSGDKPSKREDNEAYSDVPFNGHPRFQQLIRERNSYRQDAQNYREIETFIENTGLSQDEAADALVIAGLAKTDPKAAWDKAQPWMKQLAMAAGAVVVDDDLKKHVAAGTMTKEVALEVQQSRQAVKSVQVRQSFDEKRAKAAQDKAAVGTLVQTANDWIAYRRSRDPNFADKQQAILEKVYWLQKVDGFPKDAEGVRTQLNKAYKLVNESRGTTTTPRVPDTGKKSGDGSKDGGKGNPTPDAQRSTLDIINQVAAKHGL